MSDRVAFSVAENGSVAETEEGVEALLVLIMPMHGEPNLLFAGDEAKLREVAVHGLLNWPMFMPFPDEMKAEIERLLNNAPIRSAEEIGLGTAQHALAAQYAEEFGGGETFDAGPLTVTVREGGSEAALSGVAYLLFGILPNGEVGIGRFGAGSEKQFLMEYAVSVLFGDDVARAVIDVLEADIPEAFRGMVRQMRRRMIGLPADEIHVFNDDEEEG